MTFTNVLFAGDSITVGLGSTSGAGFLAAVYAAVTKDGHVANYQGSQLSAGYPHEGYLSLTSGGLLAKAPVFLAAFAPLAVVCVLIGVNDVYLGVPTAQTIWNVMATVDAIHAADPATQVILSNLPPVKHDVERRAVDAVNDGLRVLRATRGFVHRADAMHPAIGFTTADLYDDVHPNDAGYAKLAQALASVLAPLMQ